MKIKECEKIIKKIIILMIIVQIIFIPIENEVFAKEDDGLRDGKGPINYGDTETDTNSSSFSLNDIFSEADTFLKEGKYTNEGYKAIDQDQLKEQINSVYNIIFVIGVGLSVVGAAILGIKFMIGSVEEQAKIKELLVPYAVGCIVIFGAFGIWKIVVDMVDKIFY